jgi:hypothetical protein
MTAPTVEAAIHELMDFCWNVVYDLLEARGLLGDGFFVEEYTGIHSWLDGSVRYTVVHSRTLAVLFVETPRWTPLCSTTNSWAQTTRRATSHFLDRGASVSAYRQIIRATPSRRVHAAVVE